ncbi:exosome complex component CSL4-like [Babylonia areolata]|uniref:exosome complex component CSL4-like n=1 Tax=Babylonia areolata TaxID=304850 RepID=UPI003FD603BB
MIILLVSYIKRYSYFKMAAPEVKVPGHKLAQKDETTKCGPGTYERNGYIIASLAGCLHKETLQDGSTKVSILSDARQTIVPSVGALVTARITNATPRFCKCSILSIGKIQLKEPFRGMIRREDIRATEKDRVETYKCFRPGDIIVARVLSLGDAQSYVLSTAENELGVVIATSEAGATMVPISWCKMQCPRTLAEEYRKVARVQQDYLEYVQT